MDLAIYGIPAAVLVAVLVEVFKHYGLDSRWAILAAIGVGVLLSVLNHVAQIVPGFEAWYQVVLAGLVAGLTAAGLYSGQKALRDK
jgi:ABC-type iron transport system FetAB permease component